jgi:hypothetical protein
MAPRTRVGFIEPMLLLRTDKLPDDPGRTLLQILLFFDTICMQQFTGKPKRIVAEIVSDLLMSSDHLRAFCRPCCGGDRQCSKAGPSSSSPSIGEAPAWEGQRGNSNQKYRFSTVPMACTCRLWSPPVSCW